MLPLYVPQPAYARSYDDADPQGIVSGALYAAVLYCLLRRSDRKLDEEGQTRSVLLVHEVEGIEVLHLAGYLDVETELVGIEAPYAVYTADTLYEVVPESVNPRPYGRYGAQTGNNDAPSHPPTFSFR